MDDLRQVILEQACSRTSAPISRDCGKFGECGTKRKLQLDKIFRRYFRVSLVPSNLAQQLLREREAPLTLRPA